MVMRIGGARRKTRHMFANDIKTRGGKISIRRYLQELAIGDKVTLKAQPAVHSGLYFRRFHGKDGIVVGTQGTCYLVDVDNFNAKKTILVHPAHLVKREDNQ